MNATPSRSPARAKSKPEGISITIKAVSASALLTALGGLGGVYSEIKTAVRISEEALAATKTLVVQVEGLRTELYRIIEQHGLVEGPVDRGEANGITKAAAMAREM
jgi:hypothetical protein